MKRNRLVYAGLGLLILGAGLATRPMRSVTGPWFAENLGDALWAALVYLLIAGIGRRQPSGIIATMTLAVSVAVECSQLYHAAWIDSIRRTLPGGLLLGWEFAWGDLIAYAVGVAVCFIFERRFAALSANNQPMPPAE